MGEISDVKLNVRWPSFLFREMFISDRCQKIREKKGHNPPRWLTFFVVLLNHPLAPKHWLEIGCWKVERTSTVCGGKKKKFHFYKAMTSIVFGSEVQVCVYNTRPNTVCALKPQRRRHSQKKKEKNIHIAPRWTGDKSLEKPIMHAVPHRT